MALRPCGKCSPNAVSRFRTDVGRGPDRGPYSVVDAGRALARWARAVFLTFLLKVRKRLLRAATSTGRVGMPPSSPVLGFLALVRWPNRRLRQRAGVRSCATRCFKSVGWPAVRGAAYFYRNIGRRVASAKTKQRFLPYTVHWSAAPAGTCA